jgi:hypothetical protein
MLFISLLAFTKIESIGLIPPQLQRLKKKEVLTSALFSNAFRNYITQNLVKISWLRLRRDFLSDINKNLNILAQTSSPLF